MTFDSAHPTRSAPSAPENRVRRRRLARNSGALSGALVLATGSTAALLAAFAGPAGASTTFTVDSSGDGIADAAHCTNGTPFDCTFRDATAAAADGDTIDFDSAIATISLTERVFTPAVNIIGPADRQIAINKTDGAIYYDVFVVNGIGNVTVSGLAITDNGVTLLNVGDKTIDRVSVTGAKAYRGGAIATANAGNLTITNCDLSGNAATLSGGALYAEGTGNVTISNSAVNDNDALEGGGGVHLANTGTVTITDSTFDSNSSISISWDDDGGAILVGATVTGTAIANSTISANSAGTYGGGIFSSRFAGPMSITNSTISGNSSPFYGGGVYFRGSNVTIDSRRSPTIMPAKAAGSSDRRTPPSPSRVRSSPETLECLWRLPISAVNPWMFSPIIPSSVWPTLRPSAMLPAPSARAHQVSMCLLTTVARRKRCRC